MSQSTRNGHMISLYLDPRVAEEKEIIDRYKRTIKGRRQDFLRSCLTEGHKVLFGPSTDKSPRLFAELDAAGANDDVANEVPQKQSLGSEEESSGAPSFHLGGLAGEQD